MNTVGIVLVMAGAALLSGCARRSARAKFPDLRVPVSCASEIVLVGCDMRTGTPKCQEARVKYRKGCEEIVVGRGR